MPLFLMLLACNDPCSPGSDPTVELGYGATDYQPAEPGQVVDLIYGQQGGFHLELAVATTRLQGDELVSAVLSGSIDGEPVAAAQPWLELSCDPESRTQQAAGVRLILLPDVLPPDVDGQPLDVEVTVRDARGETASTTGQFVVNDPI